MSDDFGQLKMLAKEGMKKRELAADEVVLRTESIMLMAAIIAALVSFIFSIVLARKLASGLSQTAETLRRSSDQVASASFQIASTSQELSSSSTEQASSVEETASAVEQMSAMVKRNSESAVETSKTSQNSQAKAERGREEVEQLIQSMEEINVSTQRIMEQVVESNQEVAAIVQVIQQIEQKTKVINDIVFQTKLLSFNASVEAARAGESGKGFAVVAEEIGNLAQMSGNAATEISKLLNESIKKVEAIVFGTKTKVEVLVSDGRGKVESGLKLAQRCGDVLREMVADAYNFAEMADSISKASIEQSQGIQEINKAMAQLDQVTQQNAAASHEAASAGEMLSTESSILNNAVLSLVATIEGRTSSGPVGSTGMTAWKAKASHKSSPFREGKPKLRIARFSSSEEEEKDFDLTSSVVRQAKDA